MVEHWSCKLGVVSSNLTDGTYLLTVSEIQGQNRVWPYATVQNLNFYYAPVNFNHDPPPLNGIFLMHQSIAITAPNRAGTPVV